MYQGTGYSCSPTFVDSHGPLTLLTATKEESTSEYNTTHPMESEDLNTHQPGFKRRPSNTKWGNWISLILPCIFKRRGSAASKFGEERNPYSTFWYFKWSH